MSSTVTYKGSTLATVSNATKKLNTSGKYMEDDVTITDVSQATPVLQTVSKSYTPSETAQSEDVTAGSGYDGLEKVSVSVGAISSSYVGSGITRRSSSDLTASGATVTAPAGYYSSSASKAVATGSATAPASISGTSATVSTSGTSTLTLSKTVSVTPSVSAGYVSSGTAGNSNVSLSASVNIRSSSSLTASGDTVTAPAGYYGSAATKAVAAGTAGTPTATKGTVSNHSVSVTPSVTNTTGYITGSTKTGASVTVTASELASGNKAITSNGTGIDVVGYSTVSVDVAGGGSGSVYQDAEGYLVLSDEPGTSVQVDPLSVTENGTYTASGGHAYSPVVVNVSGGGGGGGTAVEEKDVNFYDYDGTLLYSYTAAEINAMTQESDLPANPSHDRLVAEGWNWTLAQIKTQMTDAPGGIIDVGQMYNTTTGDTEIDIELDDPNSLSPYLQVAPSGSLTIDWGDNTTTTITGTSIIMPKYTQHVYAQTGKYTIKLTPSKDFAFYYSGVNGSVGVLNISDSGNSSNELYSSTIQHIRLGNMARVSTYGFYKCRNLKTVSVPSTGYIAGSYAFGYCDSLKHITLGPQCTTIQTYQFDYSGIQTVSRRGSASLTINGYAFRSSLIKNFTIKTLDTISETYVFTGCKMLRSMSFPNVYNNTIGGYAFPSCSGLRHVKRFPSNMTSLGSGFFSACINLTSIPPIGSEITSIGSSAFSSCYSMTEYHFLSTIPPSLGSTNVFSNIQTYTKIYVPYSADHSVLNAYQTASNWSTYASYMQEEPQ